MKDLQLDVGFRLMALSFKIRDLLSPRIGIPEEVGIGPGFCVLDYGCGSGSYIVPLSELVGASGKIYALDVHPLAVQMVKGIVSRKHLTNVETIQSDCATGLPDCSVDVALLYDILHSLNASKKILSELHRILRPHGILSSHDHHLKGDQIVSKITEGGLFELSRKNKKTYSFSKKERNGFRRRQAGWTE